MKKYLVIAAILFLASACSKQPAVIQPAPIINPPIQNQPATTTPVQATTTSIALPIKYNNTQYGFIFSLPADWHGFSTYAKQWNGCPLVGGQDCSKAVHGPEIYIRNPKWTAQKPYEDIPVMIFTLDQWNQIQQEKLSVSAAPIPPSELGRNKIYVFALPPRFDYDFSTGYEEVEKIVQSNPLQTVANSSGAVTTGNLFSPNLTYYPKSGTEAAFVQIGLDYKCGNAYNIYRSSDNKTWSKISTVDFVVNPVGSCNPGPIDSSLPAGVKFVYYKYSLLGSDGKEIQFSDVGNVAIPQ